ncbi:MAG: SMP-30/gluconolactonase/LRE family protein [bacterium]|nr:SMP-30/gluconolactonase/LRE family protein [bacterium]
MMKAITRTKQAVRAVLLAAALLGAAMTQAADGDAPLAARGAQVRCLASGFTFTEGPATDAAGNVYFTDIPNERIYKWTLAPDAPEGGRLSVFRENSDQANGLYFDAQGRLLAAQQKTRGVTEYDMKGAVVILADSYGGRRLNSPNDLWVDPKGGLYFSDPRYGSTADLEQDGMHVYYLKPDRKTLIRVVDDMTRPNGLIGTADGTTLYVADEAGGKTWRYAIRPDGTLENKSLFAAQGSDGMTMDEEGNVYLTGQAITVYSPEGRKLATIAVPEVPANVTFGGPRNRTLFITARTSFYALEMSVKGQTRAVQGASGRR